MGKDKPGKGGEEHQNEEKIFYLAPHRFILQTRTFSFAQKRIVQKIESSTHRADIATKEPSDPERGSKDQQRP